MKFNAFCIRNLLVIAAAAVLGACATTETREEPAPTAPRAITPQSPTVDSQTNVTELPRSKYGNPPFYEVFGVRYTILPGSTDYRQKGVASWYGKKFHGRRTSSGETYDMYKMTAAHTVLPIPTNARVTNLDNGKSVIVRINDRGPFAKDRIIDLSYAAAVELDMIRNGTARVEVVALTESVVSAVPPATQTLADSAQQSSTASKDSSAATSAPASQEQATMYLQVGAFGRLANAQQLIDRLTESGIQNARLHVTPGESPVLYRVRIGPMYSIEDYDRMVQRVSMMQIKDTQLIIESAGINTGQTGIAVANNR
jgi:rare lipoprotein A